MSIHGKIRTEKTGHYFTHGTFTGNTKYVWICLHGYGQLTRYFIQRFEFLNPTIHFVIAPEGLNRFYFEGVSDRPVANWMTRQDRLDDIADTVLYLNLLRDKFGWERCQDVKIIYLGFSQGATMVLRWLYDQVPRVDHLLLWAGGLPDDLSFEHRQDYFQSIRAHFFIGNEDPYFNQDTVDKSKPLFESMGLKPEFHFFQGAHTVDASTLKNWITKYLE